MAKHGRVGSGRSIALENAARNILVAGGPTPDKKTDRLANIRLLPK
ncbi:MAG: hypothetical protein O4859_03410 [Trichodesmium sp. St18_bin1]|nr:hypothetical protein [Trichodesmium sp. St18_bin1]MDE5109804.1 hypothetical protein [Trichodesmium sp. St7_bin2_1]MDE5122208.1 hypothetical protein [Trichodesmium sp. St19_bin1]